MTIHTENVALVTFDYYPERKAQYMRVLDGKTILGIEKGDIYLAMAGFYTSDNTFHPFMGEKIGLLPEETEKIGLLPEEEPSTFKVVKIKYFLSCSEHLQICEVASKIEQALQE